jgi:hypothetical protein
VPHFLVKPGSIQLTNRTRQRIGSFVSLTTALLFLAGIQSSAQKKDYKPGERIEYRSSGYPEVWEAAIFVSATADGSQPIIRQMPNQFYKEGYQRAASWTEIRAVSARPAVVTEVEKRSAPPATTTGAGVGLMTQAEVLGFLQTNLGDQPFQNPRRDAIKKELAEIVKARGLDFLFSSSDSAFYSKFSKFGATSELTFPLADNYGAPPRRGWLMGAWNLSKIGAAVDYVKNDRVYRQGEIGVGNVGTLALNANGTYAWKSVTAQSTQGTWRDATREEMRSAGGDGIVLLKAKSGYEWIVTKNRRTTLPGDWISISELSSRQINEHGTRGAK